MEFSPVPDQGEGIAADAVAGRLDDGQGDGRRQSGVDGISATAKHLQACLGGKWL